LRLGGAALAAATGAIHLDLYLTGYRTIPTIGWLFLMQVIGAFALAASLIFAKSRSIVAAGAVFLLSTLVGYLLSMHVGLFGFREVRTSAGVSAGIIEIVGFVALAGYATRPDRHTLFRSSRTPDRYSVVNQRVALLVGRCVAGVVALLAVLAFALTLSTTGAATSTGGATASLRVADVQGTRVLTNAQGYTLYWFAPDSPTTSRCYGTCAAYWPPVIGSPSPEAGVAGAFATLKRSDGAEQVTYDGHPLYTYVGDSEPGQASGNRIRLNGGWWYEMKVSR
jgi:predicted lipoprotein with Yx(FWY)xxD motif